ncbi:MAG: DinB family protein [Puniceicoccales bacterium]
MTHPLNASATKANLALLNQAIDFLNGLSDAHYTAVQPPTFPSSVGAHLRHVLDHYDSLLDGLESGIIDYHSRNRDAETEKNRQRALERIETIRTRLTGENGIQPTPPEALRLRVSIEDPSATIPTSPERELFFGLSHTIHHYALIATIARNFGHPVPGDFGVAPSTLAHRKNLAQHQAQQAQAAQ